MNIEADRLDKDAQPSLLTPLKPGYASQSAQDPAGHWPIILARASDLLLRIGQHLFLQLGPIRGAWNRAD